MFCFVEQLCIPDCGEVAKKAESEAVFKELLASCTSRLARTTLGVRPHEEALFDIIRGSIMNLYKRDYIKSVPRKAEIEAHFSASFVTITKYSNKSSLPKEFSEYDSSRFHYAVVAGLREDYNEATYRDRRNKVTQQNILTLHYDNLYDKACELETAQSF